MGRPVVINGRELNMNDPGFIEPNSEWSVTVGEDGSAEVNRLDLKVENEKLRELAKLAIRSACIGCPHKLVWRLCEGCNIYEMATELGIEVEP